MGFFGADFGPELIFDMLLDYLWEPLMDLLLVLAVAAAVLAALMHIFRSAAMFCIARRRQIGLAWAAWVPFGNVWMLGSISDQYQYVRKGKVTNRRTALLVTVWVVSLLGWFPWPEIAESGAVGELLAVAAGVVGVAGSLLAAVLWYLCLYDYFRSCNPDLAPLALTVSVLLPVAEPFLMFAYRKQEGGMPPRREASHQPVFREENAPE